MKKIFFLAIAFLFTITISSCGSSMVIQKSENEVAGYTLKNKKELMQQKVLNKKERTVIALP